MARVKMRWLRSAFFAFCMSALHIINVGAYALTEEEGRQNMADNRFYRYAMAAALMACALLSGCAEIPKEEVLNSASPAAGAESTEDSALANTPLGLTVPEEETGANESDDAGADDESAAPEYAPMTSGESLPMGTEGRLFFEDGVSVALNTADQANLSAIQAVTDADDSAYYGSDGWTTAICDHAWQKFSKLDSYPIGYCMYIISPDGTRTDYTLTSKYYGSWNSGHVMLDDGRDPWYGDTRLFLQTCINEAGTRDVITYWTPVSQ